MPMFLKIIITVTIAIVFLCWGFLTEIIPNDNRYVIGLMKIVFVVMGIGLVIGPLFVLILIWVS